MTCLADYLDRVDPPVLRYEDVVNLGSVRVPSKPVRCGSGLGVEHRSQTQRQQRLDRRLVKGAIEIAYHDRRPPAVVGFQPSGQLLQGFELSFLRPFVEVGVGDYEGVTACAQPDLDQSGQARKPGTGESGARLSGGAAVPTGGCGGDLQAVVSHPDRATLAATPAVPTLAPVIPNLFENVGAQPLVLSAVHLLQPPDVGVDTLHHLPESVAAPPPPRTPVQSSDIADVVGGYPDLGGVRHGRGRRRRSGRDLARRGAGLRLAATTGE